MPEHCSVSIRHAQVTTKLEAASLTHTYGIYLLLHPECAVENKIKNPYGRGSFYITGQCPDIRLSDFFTCCLDDNTKECYFTVKRVVQICNTRLN